jgi:hypothetical protein
LRAALFKNINKTPRNKVYSVQTWSQFMKIILCLSTGYGSLFSPLARGARGFFARAKKDRAERDSMIPEWRKKMKSAATIFGLCALCITIAFIIAPNQGWAKSSINRNWRGLAIKGYDPVAYFTLGKPVEGKKEFEYTWQDARWRFSNEDHLNRFKSEI